MKPVDAPVHVRLKLSALWASVMFCYVYGDFFGLFKHQESWLPCSSWAVSK